MPKLLALLASVVGLALVTCCNKSTSSPAVTVASGQHAADGTEAASTDHATLPTSEATPSVARDNAGTGSQSIQEKSDMPQLETATLGAGCFWCIEAVLLRIKGVETVQSGYMGGTLANPSYEMVCTGRTGHAEVVQVKFDPQVLPYAQLLDLFFQAHDPTTLNRQGADVGTQYRSAIFYHSDAQREAAAAAIEKWNASGKLRDPIVTEVTPASQFYVAELYHQDYFNKNPGNPYCRANILPKFKKLGLLKESD
jgi:peptide-methionine (S)-S-oxide reductase